MTRNRGHKLLLILTLAVPVLALSHTPQTIRPTIEQVPEQAASILSASEPIRRTWTPPDAAKIPAGLKGESILLGMRIFTETPKYASAYVGNRLSCGDCHLQGGTMGYAIALVGVPAWFPMFSERSKRDITLEERIQECVTRSENGAPLPHGGVEMKALLDYFGWLSLQTPSGATAPVRGMAPLPEFEGDAARGFAVYKEKCSACHGSDGAGVPGILPALWGPDSYNDGAGMNQIKKMAAFVARNMPQNHPGTLTPQQAYDVSAYVAGKPHSHYNHAYDIY